jgi:hypothetical protein
VGANFGGAWTSSSLNIPGNNLYGGLTEFVGGVQAGYNIQYGRLLFGVEGDFDGAAFAHPAPLAPTLGSVSHDWIGTAAGRLGLAEGSMAPLREARRRLGAQQRHAERSGSALQRV